jgi:hypothetical protein
MNIKIPDVKGGDLVVSPIVKEKIKRLIVLLCEQEMTVNERFGILNQAVETGVDAMLRRYEPKPASAQEVARAHLKNPQVGDRWFNTATNNLDLVIYQVTNEHDFIAWVWNDTPGFVRMDREYLAWQVHVCPSKTQDGPVDFDTFPISHFSHLCQPDDTNKHNEELIKELSENAQNNVAEDRRINKEPVNGTA